MKDDLDYREAWDDEVYASDPRDVPPHDVPLILFSAAIIIVLALFILFWPLGGPAKAQDQYPNCRGWINTGCCCTTGACREVDADEVRQIGENLYLIVPTG